MEFSSKEKKYGLYFPRMPRLYWIDINNTCNLRCIMCPQSKGGFNRQPVMPLSMFQEIIDSVCHNRPLIKLYMSGEPLLHRDLFTMIDYADSRGCQTMIHTNATLLTEEIAAMILSSKLTYLSFSFDGCAPEIFEKLRYPAVYDRVKSNILNYLALCKKNESSGPHTTIEIIRMKDTAHQLNEFVSFWEKSGADAVSIREFLTWFNIVDDRRINVPVNHGFKPCPYIFDSCSILSDGTVVPCCLDVYGKMPLGNIVRDSFPEIWYGEKYLLLRKQMLSGTIDHNTICYGCDNTVVNDPE